MAKNDNLDLANAARGSSLASGRLPTDSLGLAKALRGWEEDNLAASMALGFVPGIGTAYGAASTAAAYRDPDASDLERALATASMVPWGGALRALRGGGDKMDILGHHGGRDWEGDPQPVQIGGEGNWSEGPGFYMAEAPRIASGYAHTAFKGSYDVKPPPTAKPLVRQYEIDDDVFDNYFVNLQASFQDQPEAIKQALSELYPADTDVNKLKRYHAEFKWPMSTMYDPRAAELARQQALEVGIRGNDAPWTEYIVSYDPARDLQEIESAVPEWWTMKDEYRRLGALRAAGEAGDPKQFERVERAMLKNPNAPAYDPQGIRRIQDFARQDSRSSKRIDQRYRRDNPWTKYQFQASDEVPGGRIYDFPAALRTDVLNRELRKREYQPPALDEYRGELGRYPEGYNPLRPGDTEAPSVAAKREAAEAIPTMEELFDEKGGMFTQQALKFSDNLEKKLVGSESLKEALKKIPGTDADAAARAVFDALGELGITPEYMNKVFQSDEKYMFRLPLYKLMDSVYGKTPPYQLYEIPEKLESMAASAVGSAN